MCQGAVCPAKFALTLQSHLDHWSSFTSVCLSIEQALYMLSDTLSLLLAGESEAKLRQLFQEATQVAPCIVFIGMPVFHLHACFGF